jgi:hypothetical protein
LHSHRLTMPPTRAGGGDGDSGPKKRRYGTPGPSPGRHDLCPGLRGCLITCDVHLERDAIRECMRLFEGLDDEAKETVESAGSDAASATPIETAGDALHAELQALQGGSKGSAEPTKPEARFSVAQTGCSGNVFIRFGSAVTLGPVGLVDRAMERAREGGGAGGRAPHVIRMLPVQATCAAKKEDAGPEAIGAAARPRIEGAAHDFAGTYAVVWKRKCNSDVDRVKTIDVLAAAMHAAAPKAKVDLGNAELAVVAEVIKTTCCLAVLPRWAEFAGYNLRTVSGGEVPQCERGGGGSKGGEGATTDAGATTHAAAAPK